MENQSIITLGIPYITSFEDSYKRICVNCNVEGNEQVLWYQVETEYAEYLCSERNDAFLIGIVHYAMMHGYDIKSEAPIIII